MRCLSLAFLLLVLTSPAQAADRPLTFAGGPRYHLTDWDEEGRDDRRDDRRRREPTAEELQQRARKQNRRGDVALAFGAALTASAFGTQMVAIAGFQVRSIETTGTAIDLLGVPFQALALVVEVVAVVAPVTLMYIGGIANLALAAAFDKKRDKTLRLLQERGEDVAVRRALELPRWGPAIVSDREAAFGVHAR